MSQHRYTNGDLELQMGYDRPLDFIHCTVWQDGRILYSNLSDPKAGTTCQDVEYYRPILTRLGFAVPEALFTETKTDQQQRVGNRLVLHGPNGILREV